MVSHVSITVPPFVYGRVMTSFKSQGRQFKCISVHAWGLRGGDNQLLTMISRAEGSPWAGTLRIVGIKLARAREPQTDLMKKMKPFAKSLLVCKLLGKNVEQAKYDSVRADVLKVDPDWLRVEAAIQARLL